MSFRVQGCRTGLDLEPEEKTKTNKPKIKRETQFPFLKGHFIINWRTCIKHKENMKLPFEHYYLPVSWYGQGIHDLDLIVNGWKMLTGMVAESRNHKHKFLNRKNCRNREVVWRGL